MLFSCNKCDQAFIRKDHFIRHKTIHSKTMLFSCPECKHGFRRKDSLLRHQRTHTQERTFNCLKCKKSYSRKDHLQRHQRIHTKSKGFFCPECNKEFLRKEHFKRHQRTHARAISFIPNVDIQEIHNKGQRECSANRILQRRFACTDCDESFALQITFHRHQAVHTKRYLKNISKGIGKEETNYVTKENSSDIRQGLFSCTRCNKSFSVPKGLAMHQRVHTHCYTCSECGKRFSLKCHLVKHLRIHSGHRQSIDGTLQRGKSCTAAAREEYDNENKGNDTERDQQFLQQRRKGAHCFNYKMQAEKIKQSKHPKKRMLKAATVSSKKVILKAATFVFRSSFSCNT